MTPAIQVIKTKNLSTGRALIETFLYSLNHYQKIGALTTAKLKPRQEVINIHEVAQSSPQESSAQISTATNIEKTCAEISFVDFAWIEMTQKLQKQISESQLENICNSLSAHGQVPVVIMRYLDE